MRANNQRMNIAVITALNNRPAISRIFLNNVERWKEELPDHNFTVFAAVSDKVDAELLEEYGHIPVIVERNLAGLKFNSAIRPATSWKAGVPVPVAATQPSILPSVCCQISLPVVS